MLSSDAGQSPTKADPHGDIPSSTAAPLHYVVLDIETQKGPEDLPNGWEGMRHGDGLLSAACLYDSETNFAYYYSPTQARDLAEDMEKAGIVVSFNGIGFDFPAIEGMIKRPLKVDTHIDLLEMLVIATGSRKGLSLGNMAQYTLGRTKTGQGAHAPALFKDAVLGAPEGLDAYTRLLNYNGSDVRLTRDLLLFVQKHGFLVGPHGPIHLTLPNWFRRLT